MCLLVEAPGKMLPADYIQLGLLVVAVVGIGLTYVQVRSGARTQRATFLKDLYSTLMSDESIGEAYYAIEYGKFKYGASFHGSSIEPKVDRLLAFADLVCELYAQGIIKKHEMEFFRYSFQRVADDRGVQEYLEFLKGYYASIKMEKRPFHSFVAYAEKL